MIEDPKIYNISANENFFQILAFWMIDRFPADIKTKNVIILLPTKYACFSLNKILLEKGYKNIITNSISELGNIATITTQYTVLNRISLVSKISQTILGMELPKFKDLSSIAPLAENFANFIHNIELYKINPDHIIKIIDEDLSIHKQELSLIFKQFIELWQKTSYITKVGYNNLLMQKLSEAPHNKIFIMAGISYDTPNIIQLMKRSYVILYGLDTNLTTNDWSNVDATHNQYNFKQILNKLGVTYKIPNLSTPRFKSNFISNALKPAKSCTNWHLSNHAENADNIKYLKCYDLHHEAVSIIDLLQNNPYKTAMVITQDDSLIGKLIFNLKKTNLLDVNIIRDYPLKQSNAGILLQLCLNLISDKFSPISSLALFKHNLVNIQEDLILQIEMLMRDKNFHGNSIFDITLEDENFNLILNAFKGFKEIFNYKPISIKQAFQTHIDFVQKISKSSLWEEAEGEELKLYLDQIQDNADVLGYILPKNYPQIFNHFIQSAYYRPASSNNMHSITISKPIDARLHTADLIILAGLNEGSWPSKSAIDPCLNHNFIKKTGLPSLEHVIGEEAYDFQCFAQGKTVILTRSEKNFGTITTPSRWLLRILTMAKIEHITFKQNIFDIEKQSTQEICPRPPLTFRPTKLSVTQIDKLIYNPYHIYVDFILKLKKLPPLIKKLSALDFGVFVHKALEIYHHKNKNPDLEKLLNSGKQALQELNLNSSKLQLLYWQRFTRIAKWFIANENPLNKVYLEAFGIINIGENFTLTAIADRIEITADNSLRILDYKTGIMPSNKAILTGNHLQLLLEGLLGEKGKFYFQKTPQKLDSLTYIQLSGGEEPVKILEIDLSNTKIIEQTEKYIHELISQYQNPSVPYYYTKKKKLGYCEYAHLARVF